jgi:hypothetical protein
MSTSSDLIIVLREELSMRSIDSFDSFILWNRQQNLLGWRVHVEDETVC